MAITICADDAAKWLKITGRKFVEDLNDGENNELSMLKSKTG